MTKRDIEEIKGLIDKGYNCPYSMDIAKIASIADDIKEINIGLKKIHAKVFEDNGESLISQARANRNDILDLKTMQSTTFEFVKNMKSNGQTGKTVMGKDTGDIWKSLIRLATVAAYIIAAVLGIKISFFG